MLAVVAVVVAQVATAVGGMALQKQNTKTNLRCMNTRSKHKHYGMTVAPAQEASHLLRVKAEKSNAIQFQDSNERNH